MERTNACRRCKILWPASEKPTKDEGTRGIRGARAAQGWWEASQWGVAASKGGGDHIQYKACIATLGWAGGLPKRRLSQRRSLHGWARLA